MPAWAYVDFKPKTGRLTLKQNPSFPVITIDGGAGVGKGVLRVAVASIMGWNQLDSGVLYRAAGLLCHEKNIPFSDIPSLVQQISMLDVRMDGEVIYLSGKNRTKELRSEQAGNLASDISKISEVRQVLLDFQLRCRVAPGLVAEGRDQGYVFDTPHRFFITAKVETRAHWRMLQLHKLGLPADYNAILHNMRQRDEADQTRAVSPLRPHPKAVHIDVTHQPVERTTYQIVEAYYSYVARHYFT